MLLLRKTGRGFTFIELLIVIAIIGILSAVVFASIASARQKARDAKRIAQINELASALTLYHDALFSYPSTTPGTLTGEDAGIQELVARGYFNLLPIPPSGGGSPTYIYRGLQSDGAECTLTGEVCANFVLGITLERDDSVVLTNDEDASVALGGAGHEFYGNSEDCTASSLGGPEKCYDVKR